MRNWLESFRSIIHPSCDPCKEGDCFACVAECDCDAWQPCSCSGSYHYETVDA